MAGSNERTLCSSRQYKYNANICRLIRLQLRISPLLQMWSTYVKERYYVKDVMAPASKKTLKEVVIYYIAANISTLTLSS